MAEQRPERPQRKGARPGGPANGGLKFGRGLFGWILFICLAIMLFMLLSQNRGGAKNLPWSEFLSALDPQGGGTLAAAVAPDKGNNTAQQQQAPKTGPSVSTPPAAFRCGRPSRPGPPRGRPCCSPRSTSPRPTGSPTGSS